MKIKLDRKTGTYTYLDGNNLYRNSVLVHEILLYTDIYPDEVPYVRISGQGVETEDMVMAPIMFNTEGVIETAYKITIPNAVMAQAGEKIFAVSLKRQINETATATLETFSNGVFTVVESLAGVDFENVPYDAIDELVGDLAETITKIDEIIEADKTVDDKISEHNMSADAHQEIQKQIPKKVSDLENDSGYLTEAALPTKVSELVNDVGYITEEVNEFKPALSLVTPQEYYEGSLTLLETEGNISAFRLSYTETKYNPLYNYIFLWEGIEILPSKVDVTNCETGLLSDVVFWYNVPPQDYIFGETGSGRNIYGLKLEGKKAVRFEVDKEIYVNCERVLTEKDALTATVDTITEAEIDELFN